jgi:hypothetical protein
VKKNGGEKTEDSESEEDDDDDDSKSPPLFSIMAAGSSGVKSVLSPESPAANTRIGAYTSRAVAADREIRKRGK